MERSVIHSANYDSEVEYIECDGTQYIDTELYGSINTSVECVVKITDSTKQFPIFGARDSTSNTIAFMFGNIGSSREQLVCDFGVVGSSRLYTAYSNMTSNGYIKLYNSKSLRQITDLSTETEWKDTRTFSGNVSPSQTLKIGKAESGFPTTYSNFYGQIRYVKIWSSNILVRDLIPVRVGTVGYMYDRVSNQLFGNSGTGSFVLGADVSSAVPSLRRAVYIAPYTSEVEYLESPSGNAFINTLIPANKISEFTVRIAPITVPSTFYALGADNGGATRFSIGYSSAGDGYVQIRLGEYYNGIIYTLEQFDTITLNRLTGKYYVNGTEYTGKIVTNSKTNPNSFILFRARASGATLNSNKNTTRIASFSAKGLNGELALDLIPVRIGRIGYMYDRVSKKLFGNSGTGSFTLGSDVSTTVPMVRHGVYIAPYTSRVEYLESSGTQWIDTEIVSQNNLIYDFQLTETQENNQKTFFGFKEGETETWLVNGMNDVNWGGVDETGHWLYVDFAANHTRCALGYPNRNGVYHFDFTDGNASFTLNDTTVWTSALSGTYNGSRHVFIFWMDSVWNYPQNDQYDRKGIGRIYYFQIRKNGRLLFDGIPVRKGNVGYLYDKISGKLFGNKGTGDFTLGSDING